MYQRSRRRCGGELAVAHGGKSLAISLLALCFFLSVPYLSSAFTVGGNGRPCLHRSGILSASSSASNRLDSRLKVATTATLDVAPTLAVDSTQDLPEAANEDEETKVGVLMLNLGGPETGEDVEGMYQCMCKEYSKPVILLHLRRMASHICAYALLFPYYCE